MVDLLWLGLERPCLDDEQSSWDESEEAGGELHEEYYKFAVLAEKLGGFCLFLIVSFCPRRAPCFCRSGVCTLQYSGVDGREKRTASLCNQHHLGRW